MPTDWNLPVLLTQWRNLRGRVPPDILHWEIFTNWEKRGKKKRENGEKKENCRREGQKCRKCELEGGKDMKMSRGPFFFFFFFFLGLSLFEATEICLGLPNWKFLPEKRTFHTGKILGEVTLPPPPKKNIPLAPLL